jgi:acetylornithine deacetylase/succinyl-diaminopimelate desuccinylase-like protein
VTARVLERLDELYAIAQHRAAYSPEEDVAHELAAGWMEDAGLRVERDSSGNLFGIRGAGDVWVGSHVDSVPTAGRFDGALGVVGGIEAASRLPDAELAVVAFRAEETGPMGSQFVERLPRAYLELHIEQGPVLERMGEPLGIVVAIAGQAKIPVTFEGRADHAGTTPMDARDDALVKAARFVLHVRDSARDGTVATIGYITAEPNATNVVPERVQLLVDARAPTRPELDALVARIGFEPRTIHEPAAMSGAPLEALRIALPGAPELVSGAGHDAMVLAAAGVPAAMLFVRSLNGGISHHPDELSSAEDVALAVDALTEALSILTG